MNINKDKILKDLVDQMQGARDQRLDAFAWVLNRVRSGRWEDRNEVSDSDMKSLQERLEHKDKQIEWLVRDFAEMRNDRDKYKQDVVGLRRGNENLHKKIGELTDNLEQHREALKQSEGRGDILARQLEEAEEYKKMQHREIEMLRTALEATEEKNKNLIEVKAMDAEHWHRELGASEKKRMQLEQDIKSYQEQIGRLQGKNMELHRKLKEPACDPSNLRESNQDYRVTIEKLQEELATVRLEKFNMELKLDAIKDVFEL